jgi:protein-tyrosine phosphatase
MSIIRRIFSLYPANRGTPKAAINAGEQNKATDSKEQSLANTSSGLSSVPALHNDPDVIAFLGSFNQQFAHRQFKLLARAQRERETTNTSNRFSKAKGKSEWVRNRYSDVVPYDSSRLILNGSVERFQQESAVDYINASYVFTSNQHRYVATQGPIEDFLGEFWLMIWQIVSERIQPGIPIAEQKLGTTIVMLTQCAEDGNEKCSPYFPTIHDREPLEFTYRDFIKNTPSQISINLVSEIEIENSDCTERIVKLAHTDENGQEITAEIRHYLYHGWRDMAVPDSTPKFLNFFERFHTYHKTDTPAVVHCSAGVGRTGVFIAIDYLLRAVPTMTKDEILADPVYQTVDRMRHGRAGMVYRSAQLEFIYQMFAIMIKVR